jgi:heme/copper-type cytochrome/quinol oxidase subunit 4
MVTAIGALIVLMFGGVAVPVRHHESLESSRNLAIIMPLAFQLVVHLICYHSTHSDSCFDFSI